MVVSRPFLNLANPRHLHSSHHQIMLVSYCSLVYTCTCSMTINSFSICTCSVKDTVHVNIGLFYFYVFKCLCNITCIVYVTFSLFSFLNFKCPLSLSLYPLSLSSSLPLPRQDYYRSGRMLVRMSEAIGRLVLAGRDMARLSGFTARIHQLTTVLRDLHKGRYVRTMVNTSNTGANGTSTSGESLITGNSTGECNSLIMRARVHVS